MYPMPNNQAGSKNILKVVHEADNSSAHESNQMQRFSPSPNINGNMN
jgi:hypothetical protein